MSVRKVKAKASGVVSRIGGDPDRPRGAAVAGGGRRPRLSVRRPVSVMSELHAMDAAKDLPRSGVLGVYAQLDAMHPGYGDVCVVALHADAKKLVRTATPSSVERIRPAVLEPHLRLTVPPSEGPPIDDLALNGDELAAYHDHHVFLASVPDGPNHLLLGWPTAATHLGTRVATPLSCRSTPTTASASRWATWRPSASTSLSRHAHGKDPCNGDVHDGGRLDRGP